MSIKVRNLTVTLKDKVILSNINLDCESGIYGVIGENGAGKTTLFRSILGLIKYKGMVECIAVADKEVGYLPQKFSSLKELTVEEVMEYFCCLKKLPKDTWKEEITKVLNAVNLENEKRKKVGKLSGGMNQRLGIAQAILGNAKVLILDEPTVGLDPKEKVEFRSIITSIYQNEPTITILISSHETRELEHYCQNVIFLHKGELLTCDGISSLYEKYQTDTLEQVFLKVLS